MNTFEITVQRQEGDRWPIVVEYSRADTLLPLRSEGTLELAQEDFEQLTSLLLRPKEYGRFLGQALLREEVRDAFVGALFESEDALRVLLFIEANDLQLRTLRWERLCAPIEREWCQLATNQRVLFSLYIPAITERRFPPIGRRDLRALLLVASPESIGRYKLAEFDVEAAVSGVREALGEIPCDVLANVDGAIALPTLDELCKQLTNRQKRYTLLHFVSHSRVIDGGETVLYWANSNNQVEPVTGTRLIERLSALNGSKGLPHFAFLSTCESASAEAEGSLGGLGQRLVRDLGMPAAIAMTERVTVKTALALAESFYRQLKMSGQVDLALREATAGLADRDDITVPALFSRLGGRPLFADQLERELTNSEIEFGLSRLSTLLKERAPVLCDQFQQQKANLEATLDAEANALSNSSRQERKKALEEVNNLCVGAIDLSFNALALDKEAPVYDLRCPFRGLNSFRPEDREFFFGREALIQKLQQKLAEHNFLAVLGASGSGKSSVVLAGLIPNLGMHMAYMTPNSDPLAQLETTLSKVKDQASVLVVDQFEELFTLCTDNAQRVEFINRLLAKAQQQKVIITMRADFWGECAPYRLLKELMQQRQELVAAMDSNELRRAMEMQAAKVGLRFEADLCNSILDDVQGEPGAMPLLQHLLLELWKRRHGRWLRCDEYSAIGGVKSAIAKTADDVYNSLPSTQQDQVQNIFLRLTNLDESALPGEKRRDTRRRVELEELVPTGGDLIATKNLVQQLAGEGARLVVTSRNGATGKEEVEVAHEALIRYWPRLQGWLDRNRSDLQLREAIAIAAQEWENHKDKPDQDHYLIHRGGRLEDAYALLQRPKFVLLNQQEAEYVLACVELRDRLIKQEKRRIQRQLLGTAIAGVFFAGFAIFAGYQWRQAEINQIQASVEASDALLASNQTLKARIKSLQAAKQLQQLFWPDAQLKNQVVSQLSETIYAGQELNLLESNQRKINNIAFSPDGKILATNGSESQFRRLSTIVLWDTSGKQLAVLKTNQDEANQFNSMAFSPDGKLLVTAGEDGNARLWDTVAKKQLYVLKGHKGKLNSATFSPNGKLLVTAGEDGTARLWDAKTKKQLSVLKWHQGAVLGSRFSPDSKLLVTRGRDNNISLWNVQGQQLAVFKQHQGLVNSVAFSPNSQLLATAGKDSTAILWNNKGELLHVLKGHQGEVTSVAFSPDGKFLVTGGQDNSVRLWNPKGKLLKRKLLPEHQGDIYSVAFSPNGKLLATSAKDDTVRLWDTKGKLLIVLKEHQTQVNSTMFDPDSKRLATASEDGTVRMWDTSGKQFFVLTGHQGKVSNADFSPDGKLLVTGGEDGTVRLSNTSGKQLAVLKGHQGAVLGVKFSPDGKFLVTAGSDGTARLWDSGKQLAVLKGHQGAVWAAEFSPDGKLLFTRGQDSTVRLWDNSGKQLAVLKGHQGAVLDAEFSPDGKLLVTGGQDSTVRLWDNSGKQLAVLKGHQGAVLDAEFSPDGKLLVTGGQDGTARLWDNSGKQLAVLKGHNKGQVAAEFSPDGKLVLTGGEEGIMRLWNSGKQLAVLKGRQGGVWIAEFSPDGKLLVTGGEDGTALLWDTSGKQLAVLKGHQGEVSTAKFSPNGNLLVTAGKDGTVRLWQIGGMDELLSINCDWVRDYLKNPSADLDESDRHICDGIGSKN
jgi:WD40 repeat protein/energy-coupling factor transporter ATP-binding protein EcfA2